MIIQDLDFLNPGYISPLLAFRVLTAFDGEFDAFGVKRLPIIKLDPFPQFELPGV